jgi:hypothetical protein
LFEQFKENLSLAKETTKTAGEGLRSARAAWRNGTPTKRAAWVLAPIAIFVGAVAGHFSAPWYYEAAVLVLVVFASWILGAMRRRFQ